MSLWSCIVGASLTLPLRGPSHDPTISVSVDSSRHEVVVTSGPFDLPNMPPMDHDAMMDLGMSHDTKLQRFDFPVEGWLRGFRVHLEDARGRTVSPHVIHHLILVNFSRRQLLYSAAERLMGAGSETEGVTVPRTIGIPMKPGMRLGMYVAWHNDTGEDLKGVRLELSLLWTPKNQNPPPVIAMPIYMDVNLTVGGTNTFDLPPGKSAKSYEFTLPVGGHLLGGCGQPGRAEDPQDARRDVDRHREGGGG